MRQSSCFVILAFLAAAAIAEPWPQWRGPSLDGSSGEKDLPLRWSREENVAWTLPLPARGAATPIVWGERIFLSVAEEPQKSVPGLKPARRSASSPRRLSRPRRRQDLRHQRRGHHHRDRGGPKARDPGREQARRARPGVAGDFRRSDFPAH
jgi:hypothetical protein